MNGFDFYNYSYHNGVIMLYEDIASQVIGTFCNVYNHLGYGFLEKVYENAMVLELQKSNLKVEQQQKIKVYYEKRVIGDYYADLVVEDKIINELKAAGAICAEREA